MEACGRCQLCLRCRDERAKAVYWDREPACGAHGPDKARCLLDVDHAGDHEGNGYDDYGPLYRVWCTPRRGSRVIPT